MIIKCAENMKHLERVAKTLINGNSKAKTLLDDATLSIGLASDPKYGVPASAVNNPIYVGDSAMQGKALGCTKELVALAEKDRSNVLARPVYNSTTGKYDVVFSKNVKYTADSASLIGMQTISPWNASYFEEIYKQPLLYSHARDLVKRKSGNNPWGEVQALQLAAYSGWGQIDQAGTVGANLKKNVNVQSGMIVNQIINIKIFFNFTIEEMQRAEGSNGSPFAGSLMAEKQKYAQYVIDMMTDYLTYYGNESTNTPGLFDINGETTWAGKTLSEILADATNDKKGSTMYAALSKAITDFMNVSQNKFNVVHVAMSPKAYNILTSTPYSDVYNPESTMAIFDKNFGAGMTENGSKPTIKFFADPLLSADMDFNATGEDKLVITAPEVGTGTDNKPQDILLLGIPLENFTYPVYPNSYDKQHAVLRRFSGVFAPVGAAVKVYSGFCDKAS